MQLQPRLAQLVATPENSSKIESIKKRLNQTGDYSIVDRDYVEKQADIVCRLNNLLYHRTHLSVLNDKTSKKAS